MNRLRAVLTTNPLKVLAIGDSIRGDGTDVVLNAYDERLRDDRRFTLRTLAAGLAGKAIDGAVIALDVANVLPEGTNSLAHTIGGGALGLGLLCDAYGLREYARSAAYYQTTVAEREQYNATRPDQG